MKKKKARDIEVMCKLWRNITSYFGAIIEALQTTLIV